jgi:type IV pilus assembly protein PilP
VTPRVTSKVTDAKQVVRSLALIVAVPLVLGACGFSNETEIQQWMAETRSTMKPNTQPVPEPKQFTPQTYESRAVVDPFDGQKIVMAVARQQQARASASSVKPDLDRRRETLEGFPLDQIRMVGMMRQSGTNVALVESNGSTHMLRVGSYVGQNFGLVTRITEAEVQLKEIVQDAAGEWVERPAKLELQDAPAATQGRRR